MTSRISLLCVLAISLFLATTCEEISGQSSNGKSVWVTEVNFSYSMATVDSIRKVDFKNLRYLQYFMAHGKGGPSYTYKLRDGRLETKSDGGDDAISLDHIYYFRGNNAEPEWALVQMDELSCGGSCSHGGILQVFRVEHEKLVMTQKFDYDLQAPGAGMDFNPKTRILIVRARTRDNTAHCCPKSIDIVKYRWNGKAFKEISDRTAPIEGG